MSNTCVCVASPACDSRAEDYWEGYKLFCYAYYSHSSQHETAFKETKLGLWFYPFLPSLLAFMARLHR